MPPSHLGREWMTEEDYDTRVESCRDNNEYTKILRTHDCEGYARHLGLEPR